MRSLAVATACLLLLEGGFGCTTHSASSASQQQEMADLKRTVERINARLDRLEEQGPAAPSVPSSQPAAAPPPAAAAPPPAAAAPPGPDSPAALRERWRTIEYGMTFDQVAELLGRPQRSIDESPKTVWYYSYPDIGSGSVVFIQDSGVTDWQAPPFGNWLWWP